MGANGVEDLGAARVDAADDVVAVSAERARQGERRRPELIRDCVSVSLDRLDRPGAAAADAADHLVGVSADGASRELRRVPEPSRHPVAMGVDRLDDRILRGLNAFDQIFAPLAQARQQVVADSLEAVVNFTDPRQDIARGLLAGIGEALGEAFADPGDRHAHPRAFGDDSLQRRRPGALQAAGDVVRRRPDRCSQPLAGFGQAFAQTRAGGIEVRGDAVVGGRDCVADPRPAGHDRLALIGHFGDQQPNPSLVVGIGALERRNLRLHPSLKLRSARKRAFDPIPHRRELAADGLGQVRHVFPRRRLGFGQAHGDLGDRARRLPELAQPPRQRGKGEHAEDRRQRRQQEERGLGAQQQIDRATRDGGPQGDIGVKRADRRPEKRADQREDVWRPARRTGVHRLQDGPDGLAVIVCRRGGGNRRFRFALGGARRRRGPGAKQGRSLGGERAWLENRGRGRRLRRDELGRGSALDRNGPVVVGEVQRAFDRRHRRGNRIRRRILFCHRVRLTPSGSVTGTADPYAKRSRLPCRAKRCELTTLQSTAAPQR